METEVMATKILCFSGSIREDSLNLKLASAAADSASSLGADATLLNLADFPMPIYNGDEEKANGLPDKAVALKEIFLQHDGLIVASPEYNGFFSPLLKNTIDWLSRPNPELADQPSPFAGKVAGLIAASPGGLGGLRGLSPLRVLLSGIGVTVVPAQMAVPAAHEKINAQGITEDATAEKLVGVIEAVMGCNIKT